MFFIKEKNHKNLLAMKLLLTFYLVIAFVPMLCYAAGNGQKLNIEAPTSGTPSSLTKSTTEEASHNTQDEIYIDDDGIEGSGGRGEIHEDLEKDTDYSGSGYGPDDEDSLTGGSSSSSSSASNKQHHSKPTNSRKDKTQITDQDLGSGDNADNNDDEDNTDEDDFTTEIESNRNLDIDPTTTDDEDVDIGEPNIRTDTKTRLDSSIPDRDDGHGGNDLDTDQTRHNLPTNKPVSDHENNQYPNEVLIMNEDRTASFFAQPGILAAIIGGAVVGLLCAILVVMFIVYRMRKKDEGSYALDEPKRSPAVNSYAKNSNNREFYA